jgi:hypothetical protein
MDNGTALEAPEVRGQRSEIGGQGKSSDREAQSPTREARVLPKRDRSET